MSKSTTSSTPKLVYPPGCKDLTEDVGKDELIRRLKVLARTFQELGQDDNEQYAALALHLATDTYMEHQNKDVRLLTACCVADVFRIFAPEAPYKDPDLLKEIFLFFIMQLRGLEDPDAPSFKRYFYLLENLSWVKSFNICIELEENQEIFVALFKLFFSIINEKHTSKVKTFMLDIMSPLISEADTVSSDLLEAILVNMVDPNKCHKKIAYQMAKELIRKTAVTIEPYIQAFFNNMLMMGRQAENDVSNHMYDLIYELNQVSSTILLAVIPQLEFKLKSNEEQERRYVTRLLAKMFSEKDSELATQNKALWVCFLGRFNDINVTIRMACIQQTQNFIMNHPELVKDILEQIKVRQHDPEESVRLEVVNSLLGVAKKDVNSLTPEMVTFIKERCLDKKFKIRREALLGLGALYKNCVLDGSPIPEMKEKLGFVKNKVFHHYYQNSNEDRLLVERMLNIHLVPYTKPVNERMVKLLHLYSTMDEYAVKAFTEMLKHRNNVRNTLSQLIDAHERAAEPNPPPISPKLLQLARTFPDHLKPNEYLKKLNLMLKDDRRLRVLMKTLVGPSCTCKKAEEIVKEVLKKIGCQAGTPNLLYQLVKTLLERVAPVMVDALAVDHLVLAVSELVAGVEEELSSQVDQVEQKGVKLLLTLSHYFPHYFKSVEIFENFVSFMKNDDDIVSDLALQILTNTGSHLHIEHPEVYSSLVPILTNLAKCGSPRQAKHALRCINTICVNKEQAVSNIFEQIQSSLDPNNANYLTHIVSLGHIAQLFPDLYPTQMKSIVSKHIVKDLLMKDRTTGTEVDEAWYADHLVSEEVQAKIQAMKLLVRWLLGLKSNTSNSGTSTLRLLYTVIIHNGDLMESGITNKPELARLRLQAGCCMLKLAEEHVYADIITREQFQALALMLNDVCFHVRLRFALRLQQGLISLKLPLEFMSILCLGANDPLKERRVQLKQFLTLNINKRREYLKQNPSARGRMFYLLPDYVIPYTIHLLAHDPDFKSYEDVDSLKSLKDCMWFLLEPLTHRHEDYNYAFLRRMIENIKQTKDVQCPDDEGANKKMYAVCDITLGLMHAKAGTITLKEITQEPVLPSKVFTSPDKNYSNLQSYLPKDFQFDVKKRAGGLGNHHSAGGKPGAPQTTEIVVLSHAPVVNPLPRTPLSQREPPFRRKKTDAEKKSIGEDFDQSDDEEYKPVRGRPKANKPGAKAARGRKIKKEVKVESEEAEEEELEAARTKSAPVKAGTKQTRIEDFSPTARKNNTPSSKTNAKVNGAAAKGRSKKSAVPDPTKAVVKRRTSPNSNPKAAGVTTPRGKKRPAGDSESEPPTPERKRREDKEFPPSPAVVRRLKPPTLREDTSTRTIARDSLGSDKNSRSTRPSPDTVPSSPSPSPNTQPAKRQRNSKSTDSDVPSAKRGPMSRPEPLKSNVRNGRRGRIANGETSDGEETQETETSQSSPQSRVAARSQSENEEENVTRKVRQRRK